METHTDPRQPQKPAVKGPFRAVIIKFNDTTNFLNFMQTYQKLTFQYHNFINSELDKTKCIIHYKHRYDVALMIENHRHNTSIDISILRDKLTKNLKENVLFIKTDISIETLKMVKQFNGTIIQKQPHGVQAEFRNFKDAAIAFEEIRQYFPVKFAYKSLLPKGHISPIKQSFRISDMKF